VRKGCGDEYANGLSYWLVFGLGFSVGAVLFSQRPARAKRVQEADHWSASD